MSIDPSIPAQPIPAFTGTVTRLTDTPLVEADLFPASAIRGWSRTRWPTSTGRRCCACRTGRRENRRRCTCISGITRAGACASPMPTGWPARGRCIRTRSCRWRTACSNRRTRRPIPRWRRRTGSKHWAATICMRMSPRRMSISTSRTAASSCITTGCCGTAISRRGWRPARTGWTHAAGAAAGPPYFRATRLDGPDGWMIYLSMWRVGSAA